MQNGRFVHIDAQLIYYWRDIAGGSIAEAARPIKVAKGELTLSLPDSCHLQEMQFVKENLRRQINRRFPEKAVRKIHLKIQNNGAVKTKWVDKILG